MMWHNLFGLVGARELLSLGRAAHYIDKFCEHELSGVGEVVVMYSRSGKRRCRYRCGHLRKGEQPVRGRDDVNAGHGRGRTALIRPAPGQAHALQARSTDRSLTP